MRKLKGKGRIVALDILPMEPMEGVEFIQGDFLEGLYLRDAFRGKKADYGFA